MPVSVRLDKETEKLLEKTARLYGTTKSEVVKKSIKEYCMPLDAKKRKSYYELIKDLIAKCSGSGSGDLGVRYEEILRERFKRRH